MPRTFNTPMMRNADGEQRIKRYVHSPITIEGNEGIHASIKENGRVVIAKPFKDEKTGESGYDEIDVPASIIIKLNQMLFITRKVVWLSPADAQAHAGKVSVPDSVVAENL